MILCKNLIFCMRVESEEGKKAEVAGGGELAKKSATFQAFLTFETKSHCVNRDVCFCMFPSYYTCN